MSRHSGHTATSFAPRSPHAAACCTAAAICPLEPMSAHRLAFDVMRRDSSRISPWKRYSVRRAVMACITSERGAIERIAAIATVLSVHDTTVRCSHGAKATSPHVDASSSFSQMISSCRSSSVHSP